jgi:hypothetical protein
MNANGNSVILLMSVLGTALTGSGCHGDLFGLKDSARSPRARMSSYATSTVGTVYIDPDNLGTHGYRKGTKERNGILYTCKGGHIDTPHVRKAADWTAYLAKKTRDTLQANGTEFSFKLWEPSRYFVQIEYPAHWTSLGQAERKRIARDISIRLGQYLAFSAMTWHEILTWFGYRPFPWYSETPSAFSWEDTFSNVMGTHLAAQALRDTEHSYDEAMTLAIDRELAKLGAQPLEVAKRAAEAVEGQWYTGAAFFLVEIRMRNLDIGLDDGLITASIVPSLAECPNVTPQSYPAPRLDFLAEYGFSVKFEIEPRERQKKKILRIVYPAPEQREKRIEPVVHFAAIMEYLRQDALLRYGTTTLSAGSP